jgi:inhibitor of KinA sporulation pathway (predicted exonuclease)
MHKDDVLIVDVEATCWERPEEKPPDQESEITEIGLTVLNARSLEMNPSVSMLIRPDYSEVSAFCTQLTTLTQETLDKYGISFREACDRLREEFDSRYHLWISWGDYDREMFFKDSLRKGVEYPFGKQHLNLKTLLGLFYRGGRGPGVQRALRRLNMEFKGTHHRGVDDSYNIARIYVELMKKGRT